MLKLSTCILASLWCVQAIALDQTPLPRPIPIAVVKSRELMIEAYGNSIDRAKRPSDKAKLAAELLVSASRITDDEPGRYILLVTARDLAIDAKARRVAVDAMLAIAERYRPGEGEPIDAKDQFEKAQQLWKEAEAIGKSNSGIGDREKERLRLQIQAAELYATARCNLTGIAAQLCSRRIDEIRGSVVDGKMNSRKSLPDGCLLYFSFDKEDFYRHDGRCWIRDMSGRGNDGEVIGDVKPVVGRSGAVFDGKSGYIRVKASPEMNLTILTLCAWVNPLHWKNGSSPVIAKDEWPNDFRKGYTLRFSGNIGEPDCTIGSNSWVIAAARKPVPIGTWTHLASTLDNDQLTLYINGNIAATIAAKPINHSSCNLMVGSRPYGFTDHLFAGSIDQVVVIDKALSPRQIMRIASAGTLKP